jgi:hypothetical protein
VRSSPRNSWLGALLIVFVTGSIQSAHRRDEYLQAARVAIDPDRVQIELDLTPGMAVAESVLAEVDLDRNRSISATEAGAYCARLLGAMAVDVDGTPLVLDLTGSAFPDVSAMLSGEASVRIQAGAALPGLSGGTHRLRYRNSHRSDISVYLVNALIPASERVAIASQRRDVDQRDVTIEYTLRADPATRVRGGLSVAIAGTLIWITTLWWRRRRQPSPTAL